MIMKERLARAICRANCSPVMSNRDVDCQVESGWDMWLGEAEAVLREMLEMSEPMAKAANLAYSFDISFHEAIVNSYQAAIQAAIDE